VSEVDNEHNNDSVEFFVNEAYPDTTYSVGSSQYRVAANGQLSGENTTVKINPWKEWVASEKAQGREKVATWKTTDGYAVIFQVPWAYRG